MKRTVDVSSRSGQSCGGTERFRRTRRVGSLTCGIAMIGFGVLFLLNTLFGLIDYTKIFSLWPLLLICMGGEMLISNLKYSDTERFTLVYDKGAIVLTILVTIFAVGMGITDYCIQCVARYGNVCI